MPSTPLTDPAPCKPVTYAVQGAPVTYAPHPQGGQCKPALRRNNLSKGSKLQPPNSTKLQPPAKIPAKVAKPVVPAATRPSLAKPSQQKKLQKRATTPASQSKPTPPASQNKPTPPASQNKPTPPASQSLTKDPLSSSQQNVTKPQGLAKPSHGRSSLSGRPGTRPGSLTRAGTVPIIKAVPVIIAVPVIKAVPIIKKSSEPSLTEPVAPSRTKSTPETHPTPPPRRGPSLVRTTTTLKKLPKKAPCKNYETLDRHSPHSQHQHAKIETLDRPVSTNDRPVSTNDCPVSTSASQDSLQEKRALVKPRLSETKRPAPVGQSGRVTPVSQLGGRGRAKIVPAYAKSNTKVVKSGIPGPGSKKVITPPRENAVKYKEVPKKSHSKESLRSSDLPNPHSFIRRNSLPVSPANRSSTRVRHGTRSSTSNSNRSLCSSNRSLCSTPSSQVSEDCEMNNLSIINKSPTHEPNIRSEISVPSPDHTILSPETYAAHTQGARLSKTPTEERISNLGPQSNLDYDKTAVEYKDCNLEIVINKMDNIHSREKVCSDQQWDNQSPDDNSNTYRNPDNTYTSPDENDNTYTSPDENEGLSDQELYYHSSELNSGATSLESLHDKELNHYIEPDNLELNHYIPSEANLCNSLKEKDVTKDVCLAAVLNSPGVIEKESCGIKDIFNFENTEVKDEVVREDRRGSVQADKCNQTSPFTDDRIDPLSCVNLNKDQIDLELRKELEASRDLESCRNLESCINNDDHFIVESCDKLDELEEQFESCLDLEESCTRLDQEEGLALERGDLKEVDEDNDDIIIPIFTENREARENRDPLFSEQTSVEVTVTASAPVSPHSAQVIVTTRSDSEPSTPNPDLPPFLHNPRLSNFKRSQRSITPRRSPGVLIRSVSLPKKHSARLTPAQYEQHLKNLQSLEYMEAPGNYCIVEGMLSPQPASYRHLVCPPPAAPEITLTEPRIPYSTSKDIPYNTSTEYHAQDSTIPYHRIHSPKEKHSKVIRRFSESQVFKHHKDKYMKKRQQEEKHSSCPVDSVCKPVTYGAHTQCKPDSPNNNRMNKFVKRVSSLLNPSVRPRPLGMRGGEDEGGGFFSSMLSLNMEYVARSLHDDLPDGPALAHQALSGEKNSFKRSNSLELDDSHTSGIRRTPSDRSADCDSDIVLREPSKKSCRGKKNLSLYLAGGEGEPKGVDEMDYKAKSITEQLERYGLYGLTQFDTQFENKREEFNIELESSWQDIVSIEAQNSLTNREKEQQEAIWELFSTEYNYLNNLSTCVKTFLNCLRKLKHEKFLSDINVEDLFLNIELIYEINLKFWKDCLEPCLIEARQTQNPLNPHLITEGYICDDRFYPYLEYCLKHQERIIYLDSKMKKQNDFKEYISWCENQLRSTTRLGLKDMLVKPFQRITKYPLLFKCILKKTQDEDTSTALKSMLDKIVSFVQSLNRQMQQKEDERSLKDVMSKIEGYNVFSPPTSTHGNERIDQILSQYNKLDLLSPVPVLGSQRRFLGESSSKMSTFQDRPFECHLFLFNDLLLITKPAKKRDKKYTIVKQPMSLDPDKLKITELEEHQNSILLVYLNEFGSAVDSFLLSSSSRESHLSFLNSISTAQDKFKEQKIKTLTEIDSSKSHLSNMSMESYTSSPDQNHLRLGCSITRSSSENYNRRTDTSTSVARAQSMPASNDRRLHNDPCLASSSSASSSETSGSLLSVDSSAKSSSVALSEIKENDYMASDLSIQNLDESGDENTVISDTKCESYTDNRTDNYISDNLCSDLKFKIDIDKTVLVDNDVKNQDIFNIGTEKL